MINSVIHKDYHLSIEHMLFNLVEITINLILLFRNIIQKVLKEIWKEFIALKYIRRKISFFKEPLNFLKINLFMYLLGKKK